MSIIDSLNVTERFDELRDLFETQPPFIDFGDRALTMIDFSAAFIRIGRLQ